MSRTARNIGLVCDWNHRATLTRGWTLLEILIVIALLSALIGIALPNMLPGLGDRAFEASSDAIGEHLIMARAHAQMTGRAVEVMYDPALSQVVSRYFDPVSATSDSPSELRDVGDFRNDKEDAEESRRIAMSWSQLHVNEDTFLLDRQPDEDMVASLAEAQQASAGQFDSDVVESFRLVVFVPDGSAMLISPLWLLDMDRRVGQLTINPWTGTSTFERMADVSELADESESLFADDEESRPFDTADEDLGPGASEGTPDDERSAQ